MKLRAYLDLKREAVADFAKRIGASVPTVYRWLSDDRHPGRDQMRAVHRATDGAVTPNDFVLENEQ